MEYLYYWNVATVRLFGLSWGYECRGLKFVIVKKDSGVPVISDTPKPTIKKKGTVEYFH